MSNNEKSNQRVNYKQGQIIFLTEHTQSLDPEGKEISQFEAYVNKMIGKPNLKLAIKPDSLTFDSQPQKGYRSEGAPSLPLKSLLVANITDANGEEVHDDRVIEIINQFRQNAKNREPIGNVTLQYVTPNWLMSGSQAYITGGGPGGEPVPVDGTGTVGEENARFRVGFPKEPNQSSNAPCGKEVSVVLLDTAPSPLAFDEANKWLPSHFLLSSLCGTTTQLTRIPGPPGRYRTENDRLRVYYPAETALHQLDHYSIDQHDYRMSDHGLFIAGIVNTIAPTAHLHLVRILNNYGLGTLEALAQGMHVILDDLDDLKQKPAQSTIINCSLTIRVLTEEDLIAMQVLDPKDLAKDLRAGLRWYLDAISVDTTGGQVIAAAGNEGKLPDGKRKPARYPAAFHGVIGVGAPEEYSNTADEPESEGAITEGGVIGPTGEADNTKGILGVYIGEFPHSKPNTTGWARWAGTSFAAGIITGVLADFSARNSRAPGQAWGDIKGQLPTPAGKAVPIDVHQGP